MVQARYHPLDLSAYSPRRCPLLQESDVRSLIFIAAGKDEPMKIEQVPGKPPRFPPPAAANIARAVHNLIQYVLVTAQVSC